MGACLGRVCIVRVLIIENCVKAARPIIWARVFIYGNGNSLALFGRAVGFIWGYAEPVGVWGCGVELCEAAAADRPYLCLG